MHAKQMCYSARLVVWFAKKGGKKGVHKTGLILDATFVCIHTVSTRSLFLSCSTAAMVYDLQVWLSLSTNEQEPVRKIHLHWLPNHLNLSVHSSLITVSIVKFTSLVAQNANALQESLVRAEAYMVCIHVCNSKTNRTWK
jgi:hypothetical protein